VAKSKRHGRARLPLLLLAALGVVYGDIGTSPLYALRECFFGDYAVAPTRSNVLGVLSLITWSLVLVISIKYGALILRADDDGQGGILALTGLVERRMRAEGKLRLQRVLLALGLFGAALLYGDGMITPAISVLSAVEGLEVATPALSPYVIPITLAILLGLFAVQSRGTGGIGRIFGPIMLLWFTVIAVAGVSGIVRVPGVLLAADPRHAIHFFASYGWQALTILGVVFLVVTGGEALYLDIGHLGKAPVRLGWYSLVLPCLLLNYFGQGALVLARPGEVENPFYQLVPEVLLYPMVVLATVATVIASQAIISGVFAVTYQATNLGYLPRMKIRHMSESERGQVYIPGANWLLFVATVGLVLVFQRSGNLAAAYGMAISTTMVITTVLFFFAMWRVLSWPVPVAAGVTLLFLALDLTFFAANVGKIPDGGWFPLTIAAIVYAVMATWRRGADVEQRKSRSRREEPTDVLADLGGGGRYRRVPGEAVYLAKNRSGTPYTLVRNVSHNRALHRAVVLYTAVPVRHPYVSDDDRLDVETVRDDIHRVVAKYGFMETPNVPRDIEQAEVAIDTDAVTYFVGREARITDEELSMGRLRAKLYAFLARNQLSATRYFRLPPDQVVEVGTRIRL